jgi:copper chaperone CopZ
MSKNMMIGYGVGFLVLTVFGVYYYQDVLFSPKKPAVAVVEQTVERTFNIDGMYCEGCPTKVQKSVAKIPGVVAVTVDATSKEMVVQYDVNNENVQKTLAVVKELGYTPGLKSKSGKLQVLDFNVTFK